MFSLRNCAYPRQHDPFYQYSYTEIHQSHQSNASTVYCHSNMIILLCKFCSHSTLWITIICFVCLMISRTNADNVISNSPHMLNENEDDLFDDANSNSILFSNLSEPSLNDDGIENDQIKLYCLDSNQTLRGLFTTWAENPDCSCTCTPVSGHGVIVCDPCNHMSNLNGDHSLNKHPGKHRLLDPMKMETDSPKLFGGLNFKDRGQNDQANYGFGYDSYGQDGVYGQPKLESDFQPGDQGLRQTSQGCYYATTGIYYQHSEVWMSAELPCVKCRCHEGKITCADDLHHCPPICSPGQKSLPVGPCCETRCKGPVASNTPINFASCYHNQTAKLHSHGETITLVGMCVDQKCQCVNGRWNCFDYCVLLSELNCIRQEVIVWDPFCCPRCQGTNRCSIEVDPNVWISHVDDASPSKLRRLVHPSANPAQPLRFLRHIDLGDDNSTSASEDTNISQSSQFLNSSTKSNGKLLRISIVPGGHVVLKQGLCICIDGNIMCPRPGRLTWYEHDCFYVDSHEGGIYYPIGSQWVPSGDACSQCECLANRTYVCAPKHCQRLFLCPNGQKPMIVEGECCPSYCSDQTNKALPPMQKPISKEHQLDKTGYFRPPSIGHQITSYEDPSGPNGLQNTQNRLPEEFPVKQRIGCPPLGEDQRATDLFPPGSRLLLTRSCRSLMCICARDDRWLCADHCPPCIRTFESIENLQQVPFPPPGGCCPPCPDTSNSQSNWPNANGKALNPHEKPRLDLGMIRPGYDRYHFMGPGDEHLLTGTENQKERQNQSQQQFKSTLGIYILATSMILLCIIGLPISALLTWHCISQKKRKQARKDQRRLGRRRYASRPWGPSNADYTTRCIHQSLLMRSLRMNKSVQSQMSITTENECDLESGTNSISDIIMPKKKLIYNMCIPNSNINPKVTKSTETVKTRVKSKPNSQLSVEVVKKSMDQAPEELIKSVNVRAIENAEKVTTKQLPNLQQQKTQIDRSKENRLNRAKTWLGYGPNLNLIRLLNPSSEPGQLKRRTQAESEPSSPRTSSGNKPLENGMVDFGSSISSPVKQTSYMLDQEEPQPNKASQSNTKISSVTDSSNSTSLKQSQHHFIHFDCRRNPKLIKLHKKRSLQEPHKFPSLLIDMNATKLSGLINPNRLVATSQTYLLTTSGTSRSPDDDNDEHYQQQKPFEPLPNSSEASFKIYDCENHHSGEVLDNSLLLDKDSLDDKDQGIQQTQLTGLSSSTLRQEDSGLLRNSKGDDDDEGHCDASNESTDISFTWPRNHRNLKQTQSQTYTSATTP